MQIIECPQCSGKCRIRLAETQEYTDKQLEANIKTTTNIIADGLSEFVSSIFMQKFMPLHSGKSHWVECDVCAGAGSIASEE